MKIKYFIAKRRVDASPVIKRALPLLKGSVGIITTIQYLHLLPEIKRILGKNKIKSKILGQILGCNTKVVDNSKCDTILYFGDGDFHPKAMARRKEKLNVVIANPENNAARKLNEEEIKTFEERRYAGLAKFFSSKNIGILVTLKPGQEHLDAALKFKKKFYDKTCFVLLFDDLNFSSLEDFPFIECFVNTMCPRIAYDDFSKFPKAVVDIHDVLEAEKERKKRK
ncbi:diphthamide synthesis protein [Candidatus Woesearchaeota archaeon]|nr:diphthamide synthesis protein [Candidatus Woesearchaeota archaeon]